jgi:chitosanase
MGFFHDIWAILSNVVANTPNAIHEHLELQRAKKEYRNRTMELTDEQKDKILKILQIFEVDSTDDRGYSNVTSSKGDPGGLTYGKHQTTLNSGNLYSLIRQYTEEPLAQYKELQNWLKPLRDQNQKLNKDKALHEILRKAGEDSVMQAVQDEFFDRVYWTPALRWANNNGFTLPLSMAVIYDSFIHSGQVAMYLRKRFPDKVPVNGGSEKAWIRAYLRTRRSWLAHHSIEILHKTVYRMDELQKLVEVGNWDLKSPFRVRGHVL